MTEGLQPILLSLPAYPTQFGSITVYKWMAELDPQLEEKLEAFKKVIAEKWGETLFQDFTHGHIRYISWWPGPEGKYRHGGQRT